MTTNLVKGFLQIVEEFKVARDRLLVHGPSIPRETWASPADGRAIRGVAELETRKPGYVMILDQ